MTTITMRVGPALVALAMLAAAAVAQDDDLRNPFDEMKNPDIDAAANGPPPADDAAAARQAADEEINRNFDKALANYNGIIKSESSSTIKNLEKRIEANEKLLAKNQTKLDEYRTQTRQAKVEYTRQLLSLQNGLKSGRLTEEKYKIEAKRLSDQYVFQLNQFEQDILFYKKESQDTAGRLTGLKEEHRFQHVASNKDGGRGKKKEPQLSPLEQLAVDLGGAHQFEMHDLWDDSECQFCRVR